MDYDISRWLKDDLGLSHMSEADLHCLMFHPRYGSLCRRLIKFLAESTLCKIKYPRVGAKEEYRVAAEEVEAKHRKLLSTIRELEAAARTGENETRELEFHRSRLSQLKTVQQLQRNFTDTLEQMANRPNFMIEQVKRNLENTDYLKNSSLASMYDMDEDFKHDTIISERQMAAIDDKLNELVKAIESIHISITELIKEINIKSNSIIKCDAELKRIDIKDLKALRIPPVEEVVEHRNQDEKVLSDLNADLARRVRELDQQVAKLGDQYTKIRMDVTAAKSRVLEECLVMLGDMQAGSGDGGGGVKSSTNKTG